MLGVYNKIVARINATGGIAKKKEVVEKYMGWVLIIIGAFILTFGLFGHDWFIASGIHGTWEQVVSTVGGERFGEVVLKHEHKLIDLPNLINYGNAFFLGVIALSMITFVFRKNPSERTITILFILFALVYILVGVSTGWTFGVGPGIHIGGHGG